MVTQEKEGVVKFRHKSSSNLIVRCSNFNELNSWRRILRVLNLIGQDDNRYSGAGYGNASKRIGIDRGVNRRRFLITGTQTGALQFLKRAGYSEVLEYYPEENEVEWRGLIAPSSESMTHGAIYDRDNSIRYVFHGHSPDIWARANKMGIPKTRKGVKYGTPEMSEEVERLFKDTDVRKQRIFVTAGHRDGVFSFGETADIAGRIMQDCLYRCVFRTNGKMFVF